MTGGVDWKEGRKEGKDEQREREVERAREASKTWTIDEILK